MKPPTAVQIRWEFQHSMKMKIPESEMALWAAYETAAILAEIRQLLEDGHSG